MKKVFILLIIFQILPSLGGQDFFDSKQPQFKEIPNPWDYDILPPDMDYFYFDLAEEFPFESDRTSFSLTNAWWLSEASFLAYAHPGFARMAYKLAGFYGFQTFQRNLTECYIAWNDQTCIISFRGTEAKSYDTNLEIILDITGIPVEYELGGLVHLGFKMAIEDILETDLKLFLDGLMESHPGIDIWVTGHSLGGALASLYFTQISEARGLYIFGAPRVGNSEFCELFIDRSVWRVENFGDPIPELPPKLGRTVGYADLGRVVYISKEGSLVWNKPELMNVKEVLESIHNDSAFLFPFYEHAPIYYSSHLYNSLVRLPYAIFSGMNYSVISSATLYCSHLTRPAMIASFSFFS